MAGNWKLARMVQNRTYVLDGVNLFDCTWKKEGTVELKDVAHAMNKNFDICTAERDGKTFRFAVCEIAQGIFCFYLPA